jgi:hypothetical protein
MGTPFIRLAAAGLPAATPPFQPPHSGRTCSDCDEIHAPTVDEYYFWLAPSRYFDQQDAEQSADLGVKNAPDPICDWDPNQAKTDNVSLEKLLNRPSRPMVHLHWCRVHFGQYDTPRRLDEGVPVPDGAAGPPQLSFAGRLADWPTLSRSPLMISRFATIWLQTPPTSSPKTFPIQQSTLLAFRPT